MSGVWFFLWVSYVNNFRWRLITAVLNYTIDRCLTSIGKYVMCLVGTTNNWPSVEAMRTHYCSESTKGVFNVQERVAPEFMMETHLLQ